MTTMKELEDDLHPIFKTDPEEWWNYVHKKVKITQTDGIILIGWVYTIDPVTQNWILLQDTPTGERDTSTGAQSIDSTIDLVLVIGQFVQNVLVISSENMPESIHRFIDNLGNEDKCVSGSSADLCDHLCHWFIVNRIPVKRDKDNLIIAEGVLTIEPPYRPENCISTNEIILNRIRTLMINMPDKHDIDVI